MRFRLCLFLLLGSAGVRTYAQTPTIFGASSPNWALIGNVTRVPRSQINSFCSTPAGHEDDLVLLVLDGGQLAEPTLTFQGAAVIVHGALLTGIHESVQTDIDQEGRSLPLVFPDSSVDPNTGAVCDIILAAYTKLSTSGTHTVSVTPLGDGSSQIVIFNATVFDVPIDLPGSPPDAESSSTTSAITATTTTTITSTTTPARNETSSTSTTSRDSGSAPGASEQQEQQEQHQRSSIPIAAIVVPIVLVVLLTSMGLFFCRRRRAQRRMLTPSHSESNTVQPFPQSRPSATVARKGDAAALLPVSMAESSSNPVATERSQKHLLLAKPPLGDSSTETRSQTTSSSAPAIASSDDTLTADPAQLLAIQQAVRRAGFSTQALLESLNRVQPESEGGAPESSRSRDGGHDIAPPHYDA